MERVSSSKGRMNERIVKQAKGGFPARKRTRKKTSGTIYTITIHAK